MKKIKSVLLIMMMALSAVSVAIIPLSAGSSDVDLPEYVPMEIGPDFRAKSFNENLELIGAPIGSSSMGPSSAAQTVGDLFYGVLYTPAGYGLTVYECRAVGPTAEIWVQANLAFPAGDPRPTPVITDEQVNYLLNEFEGNILAKTTEYFGTPDELDGTNALMTAWGFGDYYDEEKRNVIMVSNVRDDNYYDPTYPYYIAGFFTTAMEAYFDRNVISIDSHDWENRVGPDGGRPYMYESTIAHEYQHLIHSDYNPDDDSFMNEACSLFSEPLCGYPIDWGQVNRFLETPDNSLTLWEEQGGRNVLADYGSSFLWAMYLNDHFGEEFLGRFVQHGVPGVAGLNEAFEYFGYEERFDDVYHDWRLANLINAESGKYGYTSLDLNDADVALKIHDVGTEPFDWIKGTDFGNTVSLDGDDTGIAMVGPYGTDYIKYEFENTRTSWNRLYFDGDENGYSMDGWQYNGEYWNSGDSDLMDTLIYDEVFVDPSDPTLYLTTTWDIEDYWDFGFVQISTDDGATWTSLANEWTTFDHDPAAHPDIVASLPGITEWNNFEIVDMTFDLSAYAGQDVQVGFRYMTDWGTTFSGWYIFSSMVGGTTLELEKLVVPYSADFMVSIVAFKEMPWGNRYYVMDMYLNDISNYGWMRQYGAWADYFVIVVSPLMENGFIDYSFKVMNVKPGKGTVFL